MEFLSGGDLQKKISDHMKNKTLFTEEEVWRALTQMTKGLKTLHDMKVLHRDLKCANVFLSKDGAFKLADLNVSKVAKRGLVYTQTGTPYYASPEVWRDEPYDMKSDIWSLGCILYEMCAQKPPFRAQNMEGLFKKVQNG
jgi:NIMA (never in mitosis gene a)-related kinase